MFGQEKRPCSPPPFTNLNPVILNLPKPRVTGPQLTVYNYTQLAYCCLEASESTRLGADKAMATVQLPMTMEAMHRMEQNRDKCKVFAPFRGACRWPGDRARKRAALLPSRPPTEESSLDIFGSHMPQGQSSAHQANASCALAMPIFSK